VFWERMNADLFGTLKIAAIGLSHIDFTAIYKDKLKICPLTGCRSSSTSSEYFTQQL
jgi:hypothetical protein